ncbi:MAG: hypothetical protein HOH77_05605, partial [Candidatus Latescibacteria bacterium]|nr:hypothetical protein [Candidatus Latescibacterota bacterium]
MNFWILKNEMREGRLLAFRLGRLGKMALLSALVTFCIMGQGLATERIAVLQDSLSILVQQRDSLQAEQRLLQTSTDSLAQMVTQLKGIHGGGVASGDLALALRHSLRLTLVLEAVYGQEMVVRQQIVETLSHLSEAYDAEMGRLIMLLSEQPDSKQISKIQKLRLAKQSLGVSHEQPVLPMVMIGEDDTPSDIRLKTELMADVALQLQNEQKDVDKQIDRLADEQRLRARGLAFTNEFGLFDEASPQGRSVTAPSVSEGISEPAELSDESLTGPDGGAPPPNFDFAGIAGPSGTGKLEGESVVSDERVLLSASVGREVV